jgi:eukaryotic-like serine/threonine-protein kinase
MTLTTGTKLGRYEIRSQLGAGGMGEVYLATDTELDRTVALKILPTQLASDQQRMRRFVQEAKAASALNHQNIITIYDIGEANSTRYIATEFVDGLTLRQRMKQGSLAVSEILEAAIQITSALSAAHDAGIVHRDIKPENIMIRSRDGFVKVLDFGLVKLTEPQGVTTDTEAPTRALVNTDAGTVMGTVAYMSPEQARGKNVDARSDIWSLGVIVYEMVSGHAPFGGETPADVIAAIVKTEPPSLSRSAPEVPVRLEEIITKALEKDRDDRYQTSKDLLVDLRRLKKRVEFEAEMHRSVPAEAQMPSASSRTSSESAPLSQTVTGEPTRPTSSAEYIVSEIKRHKIGVGLACLLGIAVVGAAVYMWIRSSRGKKTAPATMKLTRLTSGGRVGNALIDGDTSISPDGRYVVFTLNEAGKISLWVRQISTSSDVQIVPPADRRTKGTTISRDGEFVYHVWFDKDSPQGALYRVPILGGQPRKLLSHINSPISFSPDGQHFAFVRHFEEQGADSLIVANADGSGERVVTTRKGNDWFSGSGPAWSADGKLIACAAGTDTGGSYMTVVAMPAEGGQEKPITSHKWLGDVHRVLWMGDGSGVVALARQDFQPTTGTQIWFISYPDGEARRITNDLNGYGQVSLGLTADNNAIVTVQQDNDAQVSIMSPLDPSSQPKRLTNGKYDGMDGISWMPDRRIVYITTIGENSEIWIMNADGTGNKQLLSDRYVKYAVTASHDGNYIFFNSSQTGISHIWRINADGGNLKQITNGDFFDGGPICSPDGQWLTFVSWRSGSSCLWKVSVNGGEPVQLTDKPSTRGFFSPDGKLIASWYFIEGEKPPWKIAVIPIEGGPPVKIFDQYETPGILNGAWWASDGRALIYQGQQNGIDNIWRQPIDGGKPQQITNFTSEFICNFALSLDGKQIALSRGLSARDVVLIRDFR